MSKQTEPETIAVLDFPEGVGAKALRDILEATCADDTRLRVNGKGIKFTLMVTASGEGRFATQESTLSVGESQ